MQLNPSSALTILLLFIVAFQVFSVFNTNKKIWCVFRRPDRTRIEKWAKVTQTLIDFDGGWYDVDPSRITIAVKWNPLPMPVRCLDFRWDSSRALDPSTFENQYTPEMRQQLDSSDAVRQLREGNRQALTGKGMGKEGMLQRYFPLICIVGFLIIGFFVFQLRGQVDKIGFGQNTEEVELGQIMKALGK